MLDRLGVAARDAALAAARERVVAAAAQVGIGPQQLDRVRRTFGRGRRRRLLGQRVRRHVHPQDLVLGPVERVPGQPGRVQPPLPEDRLDVVHRGTGDRCHHVVPGRGGAVLRGHLERLRVAEVACVVAPGVAQVDAADVGDVALRIVAVPDDHQLLVVRTTRPHAHVEQRLGPTRLELPAEQAVLGGVEAQLLRVRAPDQPAYVDTALVGLGQHLDDLAAGLAGEQLVGVPLPVGEEDEVAGLGGLETFVELGEVRRPVDQRPDEVALGPGLVVGVPVVQRGLGVGPLGGGQQPVGVTHPANMPDDSPVGHHDRP